MGRIFALVSVPVLVVGLIVAGRAIVVSRGLRTVMTAVVPCPAIAVPPVYVAIAIAESP